MQGRARGRKGERKTYHIWQKRMCAMELLNVAKPPRSQERARAKRKGSYPTKKSKEFSTAPRWLLPLEAWIMLVDHQAVALFAGKTYGMVRYRFRGTWVGPQSLHSSIPPRKGAGSASSCGTPRSLRLSLPAPGPGRIGGVSTLKGGNVVLLIGGVLYLIWYTVVIHCMLSLNKYIYIYDIYV